MGHGKSLTEEERAHILELSSEGIGKTVIAARVGRSRSVIQKFLKDPDTYGTKKPTGRPRKLSPEDILRLRYAASTGNKSAHQLREELDLPVSTSRICSYLREGSQRSVLGPADPVVPDPDVSYLQPLTGTKSPFASNKSSANSMLRAARASATKNLTLSAPRSAMHTYSLPSLLNDPSLLCSKSFIGGQWVGAPESFPVTDPANGMELAQVPNMGEKETKDAIQKAAKAFESWKTVAPKARGELLKKWYAAIVANTDDLGTIASVECGKPLAEAKGEVAYAASFIDYYAHEVLHSSGFVIPPSQSGQEMVAVKEPVGVTGIITPFNFPLAMITRKLGPCLAAGCTAVVKPDASTPLSALALAKLAEDVGIPSGVLNFVTATHDKAAEVGEALTTSKDVRKISFTGSTRVGKLLMQQAASNVKRVSFELGGNAPFIVFEDADIDAAVDGLMASKFRNTGQTCVCSNRIFLHESIAEEVTQKVVAKVNELGIGHPLQEGTQIGPLINTQAFEKTSGIVSDALEKGAKALTGGKSSAYGDNYYEPTVLSGVNESMRVWSEEIFGPVVPIFTFKTEEEALAMANSTDVGLAGYFYTRDHQRVWRVSRALEVGMIGINTGLLSNAQAPFGGVKESGLGREGSFMGLEEYMETKFMCMGNMN